MPTEQIAEGWQVQKPLEQDVYHYFVAGRALCRAEVTYTMGVEPRGPGDKDDCKECASQAAERDAITI